MCKHVAAVLYGIGARLDTQPEFLFKLRKVREADLLAKAGRGLALAGKGPAAHKVLAAEAVAGVFGLDMAECAAEPPARAPTGKRPRVKTAPARQAEKAPAAAGRKAQLAKWAKGAKTRRARG
jgi:uncharacterized Zn finger protein